MPTPQSEPVHDTRAAGSSTAVPAPQKGSSGTSILKTVANLAKQFVSRRQRPGHDARSVANYLLRHAKEKSVTLTVNNLVKLVFFSHGWTLALLHRPLIRDRAIATKIGPMIWSVYRGFKRQGLYAQEELTGLKEEHFSEQEMTVMEEVFLHYGHKSPFELTSIITKLGSPWDQVRHYGNFLAIPDAITHEYYFKLAEKNRKRQ